MREMDYTERQFMKNRFSLMLLAIQLTLLATGVFLIASGVLVTFWVKVIIGLPMTFIGFISLAMGLLMFLGWHAAIPSPSKIWLVTWFGNKTDVIIDSWPALLLDWKLLGAPVGKIEFSLERVERKIMMTTPIKCKDGFVTGYIDTASVIDYEPSQDSNGRLVTAAEKLAQLDNIGNHEGALKMLEGVCTGNVKAIAENWTIAQMQFCTDALADAIVTRVKGLEKGDKNPLNDVRGLSLLFSKFIPIFEPSKEVVKAGEGLSIEQAQREAEMYELRTTNALIEERYELFNGSKTMAECRDQVLQERMLAQGKLAEVRTNGGIAFVNATP